MNISDLIVAITANDQASAGIRAVAGLIGSVLTGALADAARASEEADAAIRGLAVAVNNAGGSWEQDGRAIEAAIEQYEHLTGVSDSKLRPALANLINETGSVDDGLDRMAAALDLAAGAHVPLEQASRMVGRVSEENLNVFKRLGLNLDDVVRPGMSAAAKEAAVLAAVSERYGGAAAAAKKPTDDWTNALGDLQVNVGGALGPFRDIVALAPGISTTFSAIATGVTTLIPIITGLDIALAPVLIALAALAALVGVVAVAGNLLQGRGAFEFAGIGGFGAPSLPEAPDFYLPEPSLGMPIVGSYAEGGIVPGVFGSPQHIIAHAGEPVGRGFAGGGDTYNFNFGGAQIYGMDDFEQQVASAVRNVKGRGGFRGVLA